MTNENFIIPTVRSKCLVSLSQAQKEVIREKYNIAERQILINLSLSQTKVQA